MSYLRSRREAIRSFCGACTVAFGRLDTDRAVNEERWSEYGYDASNTGAPETNTGPVENPEVAWTFKASGRVDSPPVVADRTAFVGSGDGNLYAVKLPDGNERWRFEAGEPITSAPVVEDGTVYVCSPDGTLYALSAKTGDPQWTFQADGSLRLSPTLSGETIYFGSVEGVLYAVGLDGTKRWTADLGDELGSPIVHDGTVYGGTNDAVYSLSSTTGKVERRFATDAPGIPALAASSNMLYVGKGQTSGQLLALAPDGTRRWTFKTRESIERSPAVVGDTVYVGTAGSGLYAVRDGTEVWSTAPEQVVVTAPAVVDETVYYGTVGGTFSAVAACDGTERWTISTDGTISSSPAIVGGTAYVGSADGCLYAVEGESETSETDCWTTDSRPLPGFQLSSTVAAVGVGVWMAARRVRGTDSQ